MATIEQVIARGLLSTPLASNYNAKQGIFNRGAIANPTSPVLIAMVTDALIWANDRQEIYTQTNLLQISDYLIWLTGLWGLESTRFVGGGGSVTPITPGGGTLVNRIDFIVDDSSVIAAGEDSVVLPQFIGYNVDLVRGGLDQSCVTTEPTYFLFNKTTGLLTIVPAAVEGELFSIIPV